MAWWNRLFGSSKSQTDALDAETGSANLDDDMVDHVQSVMQAVYDLEPLDWQSSGSGGFTVTTGTRARGFGVFGYITLNGEIKPTNGKYECKISAVCLPLSVDGEVTADSLTSAKEMVVKEMATRAVALTLILKNMG